jgi:hypothetical protein
MVRAMLRFAFVCAAAVAFLVAGFALTPGCHSAHGPDPVCLRLADGGWDYDMAGSDLGANAGLCYQPAAAAAARTGCSPEITHDCDPQGGGGAPALACLAHTPGAGGTADVEGATLTGFIHAWQNGPDATDLVVTVYDATQLITGVDPVSVPPLGQQGFSLGRWDYDMGKLAEGPGQRRGCDVDPAVGCALGRTDCGDCPDGYLQSPDHQRYCRADGVCAGRLRWEVRYSIPAVPTDRPLVIRVAAADRINATSWVTTYEWNVFASPRDHVCASAGDNDCYVASVPHGLDPAEPARYQHDLTVLSTTDVALLAQAVGRPGGGRAGLGLVLGEVRDCDGVRVANAEVALTPSPDGRFYLAGDERGFRGDPRQAATGTGPLGLFVAFDQPLGKTSIEAVGTMGANGTLQRLGRQDVVVYRDTATFLSVNAGRGTR